MSFRVFINGVEVGELVAADYRAARKAAKRAYRVSCDCIGVR
jgi:hypothetical protein